jgi:hypothetical protein
VTVAAGVPGSGVADAVTVPAAVSPAGCTHPVRMRNRKMRKRSPTTTTAILK